MLFAMKPLATVSAFLLAGCFASAQFLSFAASETSLPAGGFGSSDNDLALQWPQGENVCSGFWIYHPYAKMRQACRDASHGYEHPIEKHEVLAFETQGSGIRSCGFMVSNAAAFPNSPETRRFNEVRSQWTNVDVSTLRAQDNGVRDRSHRVLCYVTVWNTPPFVLKVSKACPIVIDPAHYNFKKLLSGAAPPYLEPLRVPDPTRVGAVSLQSAYESKGFEHWYDIPGKSRIVRCSTGDPMPVDTPEERLAKLHFEVETLTCPARLFRFDQKPIHGAQCNVNWNDEINRDHGQAMAALRSLVYSTIYLHELRVRYNSSFDQNTLVSADRSINLYKRRLPEIIRIFQLALPHNHEQSELPDFLSLLINLD
jgi:hypothetical protein